MPAEVLGTLFTLPDEFFDAAVCPSADGLTHDTDSTLAAARSNLSQPSKQETEVHASASGTTCITCGIGRLLGISHQALIDLVTQRMT